MLTSGSKTAVVAASLALACAVAVLAKYSPSDVARQSLEVMGSKEKRDNYLMQVDAAVDATLQQMPATDYFVPVSWKRTAQTEYDWASSEDAAIDLWVSAAAIPAIDREVQRAMLRIDTSLLIEQGACGDKPGLECYPSYSINPAADVRRIRHTSYHLLVTTETIDLLLTSHYKQFPS